MKIFKKIKVCVAFAMLLSMMFTTIVDAEPIDYTTPEKDYNDDSYYHPEDQEDKNRCLQSACQVTWDDVDFENSDKLIDDGVLASFDILQIIAEINETFDVEIPATAIIPANFNSASAMYALIQKLKED